jgi:putative urate catabolism protein
MVGDGYSRDLQGYGREPPQANWPNGARIAVNFVLNYEEGGERCVLHGDDSSEHFLSEIVNAVPIAYSRHMTMESLYEYGSRIGVWRILRLFDSYGLPLTIFAVAMAAERNPTVIQAMVDAGHEICSHGYRWIDYQHVDVHTERDHVRRATQILTEITGTRPLGWYTGRTSPNTRQIVVEEGGFLYDADDYSDDLPHWEFVQGVPHLVVPYTLDANDMRFSTPQGFNTADHFFTYLRDTFDTLYAEGEANPRLMSVGLHCRLIGRPGRIGGLARFIDHVAAHSDVWVCRKLDIAQHWIANHPPQSMGVESPSRR